jgi:iron complex outermembrane recepter protein
MFLKKIKMLTALLTLPFAVCAQMNFSGIVREAETGKLLAGATATLNDSASSLSDETGQFLFDGIPPGKYRLVISYVGYKSIIYEFNLKSSISLPFSMTKSPVQSEEVIVSATRAKDNSATTFSIVGKEKIKKENLGQDLPYLLNQTPSVVVTSEAGNGVGYTGIRIRGSDGSRTNLTINGIPLNDAESQGTFLVNVPDLASSVDNIQVQRGVGPSTNGAGAFGASINIQTDKISRESFAEVNNSYGSFNTWKHTAKFNTGLINDHWNFEGRLSKLSSDGYVDRATSDLKSFFTSGSYISKTSLVKLNVFSGQEKTYQSWYGLPEDSLKTNRTYNYYTYDNQTDNYQQDHYQLFYSQEWNKSISTNIGLHYTHGRGYYEEYRENESFASYQLDTLFTPNDTILSTDLIRRRWLDNDFYGMVYSLNYQPGNLFNLIIGGGYNEYHGDHFGEIIWARFASNSHIRDRYYQGKGVKKDNNVYAKASYKFLNKITLHGDVQLRTIDYRISGTDNTLSDITTNDQLTFVNPKAGVSAEITNRDVVYASLGIANKEPSRDDYIVYKRLGSKPKSENLTDLELGYKRRAVRYTFEGNVYWMNYKDQLIPTGTINDVGSPVRINVPESYRAGVELSLDWRITQRLTLSPNIAFSENKIAKFTAVAYEMDADYVIIDTVENNFENTDIAFSPSVVAGNTIRYEFIPNLNVSLISKYVGKQYLDNTSNETRKLDPYFLNDISIDYKFSIRNIKEIIIILRANNIFDEEYEANGYSSPYAFGGTVYNYNGYYPQAGRNFQVGLNLRF